jgi:hypothetical protein
MVITITKETKREGQRKAKIHTTCKNLKGRGGESILFVVGNYFTHYPFIVTYM